MAKVKVPVWGTVNKAIMFDPDAGERAEAAVAALAASIAAGVGSTVRHSQLQGLQVGDDHPQYAMWQANEVIQGEWNFTTIPEIQGDPLPEYIQDLVGALLVDSSTINFTYNDLVPSVTADVIQSANYSWTGQHLFAGTYTPANSTTGSFLGTRSSQASLLMVDSTAAADQKYWEMMVSLGGTEWRLRAVNDAFNTVRNAFTFNRSGNAVTAITFGNSTDLTPVRLAADNQELQLGASQDMRLYHDGTDCFVRADTGLLRLNIGANTALQFNSSRAWGVDGANYGSSGQVLTSNGSGSAPSWQNTGAGAMTFVSETVVSGAAATNITVSSLNIDNDECYYVQLTGAGATAGTANFSLFFNGDTTASNYERSINQSQADNAIFGGAYNNSPFFYSFWIRRCPVTGRIFAIGSGGRIDPGAPVVTLDQSSTIVWDTSANLTSITFNVSVANQIAIGSMVRVWKIAS